LSFCKIFLHLQCIPIAYFYLRLKSKYMELTYTFDPREYIKGIQSILISNTKRIGFLFGAGTSMSSKSNTISSCIPKTSYEAILKNIVKKEDADFLKSIFSLKVDRYILKSSLTIDEKRKINILSRSLFSIPGIKKMTESIVDLLSEPNSKKAIEIIKSEFSTLNIPFNIEYILSNIIQKEQIIGNSKLDGISKSDFFNLRKTIEAEIINLVSIHKYKDLFTENSIHSDFAKWICQANRNFPIEIFTTNYDYLFELGFENIKVSYFDGFVGSFEPFFHPDFVEDFDSFKECTKLWKIHGSLGWTLNEENKKIIRNHHDENQIIVYPSLLKYDNSKKQPYVSFMDRLSKFISTPDSILFILGYSFGDQHINETIISSLKRSNSSHVVAFLYDKYEDLKGNVCYSLTDNSNITSIAKENTKLSVYGMQSAVIGGKFGKWRLEQSVTEDEDAVILDLYFEDNYSQAGIIKSSDLTTITDINSFNANRLFVELFKAKIIDRKGNVLIKLEDITDEYSIELSEKFNTYEKEILNIIKSSNKWTGEGVFKLPDFERFIFFLSNLNSENYIKQMSTKK